ncbi:hypothetical protein IFM89_002116 [Coptis chinensis]|uniref:Uncharacterized protein n=1 Tax=Coptis chinensis TaxID=261450 RepID=A0A835LKZ6_9MAGN|nr:hypothetical protein IFM89_002116 [Coptis chinensis]
MHKFHSSVGFIASDAQENGETTGSGCSSEYKEDGSDISKEKNGERESCELGNQSDITEERDEVRETAELPDGISSQGQEANSDEKEAIMIKTDTKCFPSTALEVGCFQEQQCKNISIGETHFDSEFSFPTQMVPGSVVEGRDIQEWSDMPFGSPKHQSLQKLFSQEDGGQHGGDSSSEIQNELQVAIWHEKPNELGGVLEALQQAKLSLQNELNRLPLARPAWPSLRMSETLLPSIDTVDFMNIPNGCAGLFRVPTDLRSEATPKANILLSHFGSKTSLTSKYPNVGVARSDPYSSSPYLEMYSRDSFLQPYFDPLMDAELAVSSTRFNYHLPPELMPRVPCNDGMVKTFPSIRPEALSGDHSSIYHNNHNRLSVPRMY